MKIKRILISQPQPTTEKSPYFEVSDKYKVALDFFQFIRVEGVSSKEYRASRVNILEHTAVIFNSRIAIDHFFRICEELRIAVPDAMKYFCTSESIAVYLQKYIVYRKRKIFFGLKTIEDLLDTLVKHKEEKFLVPTSSVHNDDIPALLTQHNLTFTKSVFYKTLSSELSHLNLKEFDMLVFYSPAGIDSLFVNFPNFVQDETFIGTFGPNTAKAAEKAGLRIDLRVPSPEFPSMTMALDKFLGDLSKKSAK
ncbi:MAG: uroporphyrinogen-III synthase [Bacteroidales bacterium]|nr:uroporphyrinogen-III synthase [Bacteroidales bacterium]